MKCQIRGCEEETTSKNGLCCRCFRMKKDLKKYLLTEGGMIHLKELLRFAFGKGFIDIDPETGEPNDN